MMLMACDQSVRGFAIATAPTFWAGDWSLVRTSRCDGGPVKRGDDVGRRLRMERLFRWVDGQIAEANPNVVGFESYGYGSGADYDVVELVGAVKLHCWRWQKDTETINIGTARKALLGFARKKDVDIKDAVHSVLTDLCPWSIPTLDESDALCILNSMIIARGGLPLVPKDT